MKSTFLYILLTSITLLHHSTAIPPHRTPLPNPNPSPSPTTSYPTRLGPTTSPQAFFEVTKPITHPNTTPYSYHILQHHFAYTYNKPPARVPYAPPSLPQFSTVILDFSATCQGRQFDRILGVWLGGVELLRSSTAEPTRSGIFWNVQKDVSKYASSLMQSNQSLVFYLGNVVDHTYTGVYHVNVTFHFYPPENPSLNDRNWADLVLPLSRNLPLNDGLWFEIQDFTRVESKQLVIPVNVYRAVLEVYVSYHENDEFWDTNLPNEYLVASNLTKGNGNGNFREVLVSIDGELIGAVCPFTVIFTGGINPLLWRPISGIGSFDLPSYDIEITPFLGMLLDGKSHSFGFTVTNSLNVWFVDANLHLWVDDKERTTKGQLLKNDVKPLNLRSRSNFKGLDGEFFTGASRFIKSSGWVVSSHGNITTTSVQKFDFRNLMTLSNNGNLQIVNRTIEFNTSVTAKMQSSSAPYYKIESHKRFPVYYYGNQIGNQQSYTLVSNVTLGFNEDKKSGINMESFSSSLRNEQQGNGIMVVKNDSVVSGIAGMHQVYNYDENHGKFCYFRNISSYNYTILFDEVREKCNSGCQDPVSGLAKKSQHGRNVLLQRQQSLCISAFPGNLAQTQEYMYQLL